ncbi:MAG TPA: TIGR02147 family protein, partial [Bdellovibrionales bacterium]|nr:TIGR02147 family protein [Bdellovibrionales bacterium]
MERTVFAYTDYREFLRDFYENQKKSTPGFSYRLFAQRANLASPNYLKLVIDGDRRVTDKNIHSFIRGLRLNKSEADYFRNIVLYKETPDIDAKETFLKEALRLRMKQSREPAELEHDRLEILKSWHHWAIREMVLLEDFRDDPAWVAARLKGRITPKQAAESLELLKRLRFITEENGKFKIGEPLLTTGDEVAGLLIKQLHRQFIELGLESLFNDTGMEREAGSLTIALPKGRLPELKKAIKEFRRELNRSFTAENGDEVYHLVINLFPLTGKAKKGVL